MSVVSQLRVVRERFRISHPAPLERQIIDEFTLKNETDEFIQDVFLIDLPLMLGLEVLDENNKRLSFLPNSEVRRILEETINDNEQVDALITQFLRHHGSYFLWIRLTTHDRIFPGDYKIIRLKYLSREKPQVPKIVSTLYDLARYTFNISKTRNQNYDIFINIQAPAGCNLKHRASANEGNHRLTEIDGFYQTRLDSFVQIRIPNRDSEITCEIGYDIQPPRLEKRFVSLTLILLYVASILLVTLTLSEKFESINEFLTNSFNSILGEQLVTGLKIMANGILKRVFEIAGGIIATSVAIAGLVRNPLFARARWFYIGTTALGIISFIIKGG